MANYKQLFMNYMDAQGVKYVDKGDNVVLVTYNCKNIRSVPVYVFFDKEGDALVQLYCWDIANFGDKMAEGMIACNTVNSEYRWVKYYVNQKNEIVCTCDAYIDEATCGSECLSLVHRVVNITDEVYPSFMRALYD